MGALLRAIGRRRRSVVIVECRRCGTPIDGSTSVCPTCGGAGFAEYELPG